MKADDAGQGASKRAIPVIARASPTPKGASAMTPASEPPAQPPPPAKNAIASSAPPQSPPTQPRNGIGASAPAKGEKSLGSLLFENESAANTGSKAGPHAGPANHASAWPGNVPSLGDAEKIVAGRVAPPAAAAKLTQDFLASLTAEERTALTGGDHPALKKLRMAIAGSWRLSLALATKPGENPQINTAALDQMLSEVDILLSALGTEEAGDDAKMKQAFGSVRGALAKNAVDIAEIAFKAHQASAVGAADSAAQKYQKISARIISNSSAESTSFGRRQKAMIGMLVASVLGAGAFHGYNFFIAKPPPIPTFAGAPPNAYGTILPNSAGMSMVQNLSGKPLTESEMQSFRSKMEAEGKGVKDMGHGLLFVVPKDSPLLLTPPPPDPPNAPSQK